MGQSAVCVRFTSGPSHRFLQVATKGIGDDTYFYGWIMLCSRKSKPKYALSSVFHDTIY